MMMLEHEEDDEDEETLVVQVNSFYNIGNISASYYTTLDVVRTFVSEFHISAYPTFVIAEGNPFSNEMEGMLRYARLVSPHPAAITRFLQDEIFNHEQSLRSQ
ncbi:hypothetical protein PAECIP111893_03029 [Paenibacillus plantiphilus]|uniref:Thioredoxin-like fold domain-containing protein n=1 Tax=Paenibacillus plantiphilus TaxID=2905650 RepID=A0ABM9CBI4_9BACL|nr:hypothetical protein [Paenibacillus plantiphilus]CAH1209473.1 hypothetical protein PAECIP111893_03029 [Paenibacillus plantiphilus]